MVLGFRSSVRFVVMLFTFSGCDSDELFELNPQRGSLQSKGLFSSIQDYAVSVIYKTVHVIDAFACISACIKESFCQSVNFEASGKLKHICELSQKNVQCGLIEKEPRPGFIHYFAVKYGDPCSNTPCKNGATCEPVRCGNNQIYRCACGAFNTGQNCQLWTVNVSSCKDIFNKTSYRKDMAYTYMIDNKQTDIYCHLSSNLCGSGGWTLAMKTNGSKPTFNYSSTLWSSKQAYEPSAGKTGFDNHETKMPSYWAMPFQSLCVGLKVGNNLTWIHIPYPASSLYDVIADGKNRSFTVGRNKWLSLVVGSSMQMNCNFEGFNVGRVGHSAFVCARIGIVANQENNCDTPDSVIGLGFCRIAGISGGNYCGYDGCNEQKRIVAFGYLLRGSLCKSGPLGLGSKNRFLLNLYH